MKAEEQQMNKTTIALMAALLMLATITGASAAIVRNVGQNTREHCAHFGCDSLYRQPSPTIKPVGTSQPGFMHRIQYVPPTERREKSCAMTDENNTAFRKGWISWMTFKRQRDAINKEYGRC